MRSGSSIPLRNTTLTIATIASESGFCSASHIELRMKADLGVTPNAYRHGNEP